MESFYDNFNFIEAIILQYLYCIYIFNKTKKEFMKKFITLTTLLSICYFFGNAQVKKGTILLGGQISFNDVKVSSPGNQVEQKNKNSNFIVSIGKAFKENTVWGAELLYGSGSLASPNNNYMAKSRSYGGGIYFRKYKTIAKDLYFFADVSAGYNFGKTTMQDNLANNNLISRSHNGAIALMPGISYQIFKSLHIEVTIPNVAALQYSHSTNPSQISAATQKSFSFSSNLSSSSLSLLGVGFRCFL